MFRGIISVPDIPGVKDFFPSSPGASQCTTFPTGIITTSQQQQHQNLSIKQQQQENSRATMDDPKHKVVIKTPSRSSMTMIDGIEAQLETTSTTTTSVDVTTTSPSPASPRFSPKLSPISCAPSITTTEYRRHKENRLSNKETREPPSPLNLGGASQNQSLFTAGGSILENDDNDDDNNNDDEDDFVDLSGFFLLLQRREWKQVLDFLVDHPTASKQTIHSKNGITPLLHIVLRYGPPLSVLDMLLSQERTTSTVVWKQTDMNGRLPLHAACCCGPYARLDVISKIIAADPLALQSPTLNKDGRLPLHIAVVNNAPEEIVLELLAHYPKASFLPDSHGKIALEYAQNSCYGHNRLVVALELAPLLVKASKAGSNALETKMDSLRQAHGSYEEELKDRFQKEKMDLLSQQVRSNNELADEKERNIALAEALLEARKKQESLQQENEGLLKKLDRELLVRRTRMAMRDEELKRILLGKNPSVPGKEETTTTETETSEDQTEVSALDLSTVEEEDSGIVSSSTNLSLPILLRRMVKGYESSKLRNQSYKKLLDRQRETVRNLNLLLSSKEEELRQSSRKSKVEDGALKAANDRVDQLAVLHRSALADLAKAKIEVEEWKRIDSERERKLAHSERRLRIQEKRLNTVQNLIASLNSLNNDNNDDSLEDAKGDAETESITVSKGCEASTLTDVSVRRNCNHDVSVEIEMAAAHFDWSVSKSPSTLQREINFSQDDKIQILSEKATSKRVEESSALTTTPVKQRRKNYERSTPQTMSTRTVTTTSTCENDTVDDYVQLCIPQTPPVPKSIEGDDHEGCSPMRTPDFGSIANS